MDSATDVGFEEEKDSRQVRLKTGAMRCEVTPQRPDRPLVFQTPHAELTVLGTAFELTATPVESRVRVLRGRVRWTAGGRSVEVAAGELSTADIARPAGLATGCDLDFSTLKTMPPQLETVYCDTQTLHTAERKIVPAPNGIRVEDGGLRFVESRTVFGEHGLLVSRWQDAIGSDVAIEVDVAAGAKWSLGIALDGDSFEGIASSLRPRVTRMGSNSTACIPPGRRCWRRTLGPSRPNGTIPCESRNEARVSASGSIVSCGSIPSWTIRWRRTASGRSPSATSASRPLIRALRVWKVAGK